MELCLIVHRKTVLQDGLGPLFANFCQIEILAFLVRAICMNLQIDIIFCGRIWTLIESRWMCSADMRPSPLGHLSVLHFTIRAIREIMLLNTCQFKEWLPCTPKKCTVLPIAMKRAHKEGTSKISSVMIHRRSISKWLVCRVENCCTIAGSTIFCREAVLRITK